MELDKCKLGKDIFELIEKQAQVIKDLYERILILEEKINK